MLKAHPLDCGKVAPSRVRSEAPTPRNVTAKNPHRSRANKTPASARPRLHFWNAAVPKRLEVYHIDSEFALKMTPNTYPDEAAREAPPSSRWSSTIRRPGRSMSSGATSALAGADVVRA
jgi:hypothetical protein